MHEQTRLTILQTLYNCPIVSTNQIAKYFNVKYPDKRASEALLELEQEKVIEGKRRGMNESKVWRLSKKGRESMGIVKNPIPFSSNKINHYLGLVDVWQELNRIGTLKHWQVELREKFNAGSKPKLYAPDAFFIIQLQHGTFAYLLELQQSPLTTLRWGEKWAVTSAFMESAEFKTATFQIIPGKIIKPRLLVLSSQQHDTIQGGSKLQLLIGKNIRELLT